MLVKNIIGILIIISNLVGIVLVCMNSTIAKYIAQKKQTALAASLSSSVMEEEEAIRDDLLKDLNLSDLDDLNLDDFE